MARPYASTRPLTTLDPAVASFGFLRLQSPYRAGNAEDDQDTAGANAARAPCRLEACLAEVGGAW